MLNLYGNNVTFTGNKKLLQFVVTKWKIEEGDEEYNKLVAKLTFKRMYSNYIATTYVPSFCILLATECTVFFKKEHFKTSIPVTITNMLGDWDNNLGTNNNNLSTFSDVHPLHISF